MFIALPWLFVSGFFLCCGCAIAALILERKQKDERRKLEARMVKKLQDRYDAYVELEAQVQRVVSQFERHENSFEQILSVQRQHIDSLRGIVDHHEPAAADVEASLSWMNETGGEAQPERQVGPNGLIDLDALVERLEAREEKRRAELDRQRAALEETNMRRRTGLPVGAELEQRNRDVAERDARIAELEERCRRIETAEVDRAVEDVDIESDVHSLATSVARAQRSVEQWQRQSVELDQAKTKQLVALQERLSALQPLFEQLSSSAAEADELRARCAELEQQIEESNTTARRRDDEVQGLRGELANLEGRLAKSQADCETLASGSHATKQSLASCERELASVRCDVENARGELAAVLGRERALADATGEEIADLRAQVELRSRELDVARESLTRSQADHRDQAARLQQEIAACQKEIADLQTQSRRLLDRCESHEATLEARAETLRDRETRIAELAARVEVLNARVAELDASGETMRAELQDVRVRCERAETENARYKAVMATHAQQFEVAHSLLNELKPVIESLETELTSKPAQTA